MAVVVAHLARLLQPAMALPGGEPVCQGLTPWYLLLGLRLVAIFVADGPWSSAKPDLACNWTSAEVNIQPFCSALCFNQHFSSSVSSLWGFAFLVSLVPVGLMRLIRAVPQHNKKAARGAEEELTETTGLCHNVATGINMAAGTIPLPSVATFRTNMVPSDSKKSPPCTRRSVAFSFCVILLLATELCFLWIVISLQIPSASEKTFLCLPGAQTCPQGLECVMAGNADKQVALWALAFTAFVNVAACLAYLLLQLGKVSQCHGR